MDTEVQPKSAERIIDVGRVADKKHAALAKSCCYPLMDVVEIAVDDLIAALLRDELLQPLLDCVIVKKLRFGLIEPGRR